MSIKHNPNTVRASHLLLASLILIFSCDDTVFVPYKITTEKRAYATSEPILVNVSNVTHTLVYLPTSCSGPAFTLLYLKDTGSKWETIAIPDSSFCIIGIYQYQLEAHEEKQFVVELPADLVKPGIYRIALPYNPTGDDRTYAYSPALSIGD